VTSVRQSAEIPAVKKLAYLEAPRMGDTTDYPIQAMEKKMRAQGVPSVRPQPHRSFTFTGRVLSKMSLVRNVMRAGRAYIVPMMHCSEYRLFPKSYFHECIPYTMDVWPPSWPRFEAFVRRNRIRTWFITARQSAQRFQEIFPNVKCLWLPEAIDPGEYRSDIPLEKRTIHVLELGRKWDAYHAKIEQPLADKSRVHLYEKVKGKLIFGTRQEMIDGFVNSVVSVCFPQALTHPERAGNIETVTLRYFETIACKCVPVGRCPQELIDLFGFNPMIEADVENAASQIEEILANPGKYQLLVDRNFQRLTQVGTWDARVRDMLEKLKTLGYEL
jgi:hypothetical protein